MKILLLGANGFVGTNILPYLLQAGVEVVAVCRNPKPMNTPIAGLSWVSVEDALITHIPGVQSLLSLAGVGTPSAFEQQAELMAAAELEIAELIAKLAAHHNLRSVQYLSTAGAAYGEGWVEGVGGSHGRAFTEDCECNPVSVYGRSKIAAETHLASCLSTISPSTTLSILRATNIYGYRYTKSGQQGLINALLERWSKGLPIMQYGDGLIYRDYLFASDLASAHLACLNTPVAGVFNIGAGQSHSILEVVTAVESATGSRFERQLLPARTFDVRYSAVSIDKARQSLGWSPLVRLQDGISRLLEVHMSNQEQTWTSN